MTEENVQITGTFLGEEDHGIFTCYLYVKGHAFGQAFGGYALDEYNKEKKVRVGTGYGLNFIKAILSTLKINEWEKLPGTYCRIRSDGLIQEIGHLVEDRWFDPKSLS